MATTDTNGNRQTEMHDFVDGKPVHTGRQTPDTTPPPAPTPSLDAKLARVMAEVGNVPKRGHNKFHDYKYVTAPDIYDSVRRLFAEQRLTLVQRPDRFESREVAGRNGRVDTILGVHWTFQIRDGDSGEVLEVPWYSEGMDAHDKAFNKAVTSGRKYFLVATLMIASDVEDADAGPGPDQDQGQQNGRQQQQQRGQQQGQRNQQSQQQGQQQPAEDGPDPRALMEQAFAYAKQLGDKTEDDVRARLVEFRITPKPYEKRSDLTAAQWQKAVHCYGLEIERLANETKF